jgi:hypothetical protein
MTVKRGQTLHILHKPSSSMTVSLPHVAIGVVVMVITARFSSLLTFSFSFSVFLPVLVFFFPSISFTSVRALASGCRLLAGDVTTGR